MRVLRHIPTLVAAAVMVVGSVAASAAADRDRLRAFLNVTGFDVALESIKLSAADAPRMLGFEARDFGASWTRLANEVFDVKEMQGMAMDILAGTLSDEALTHAAQFYATDLGQRLVAAENASHMTDSKDKQASGRDILAELQRDNPERVAILERMSDAIDADGNSVRAVQEIEFRFLIAARDAGIIQMKVDEDGLRAMQAEQADELKADMRLSSLAASAGAYRDFSDAELTDYAEALEQPLMQEVYELMNAVQYEIMANRFEVVAGRMAALDPGQEL
ncbi:DUF2059 domain-containing protein [Pseudooceanicola sp. 216_PA32_1]|uniref:DUF2059 domain-containing protein n=1 Tax=Pseudooceanicola pacificus TaxID=2676438 RepID=A0A844W001_9RHOB|nr:DUF2059 domain-containing protein [Pseudooceanicola pacificus]MWB77386.1 DUF2059 domain-containing protein [Pseudooceanicola pacificus]